MTGSPFLRDVPAAHALDAWRAAREADGCPARLPAGRVPLAQATGRVTAEPVLRGRLARDVPSAAGRLDVVQVRLEVGVAVPLFGLSALLSILTAADGYVVVPEEATGLGSGTCVDVTLYR